MNAIVIFDNLSNMDLCTTLTAFVPFKIFQLNAEKATASIQDFNLSRPIPCTIYRVTQVHREKTPRLNRQTGSIDVFNAVSNSFILVTVHTSVIQSAAIDSKSSARFHFEIPLLQSKSIWNYTQFSFHWKENGKKMKLAKQNKKNWMH